MHKLNVIKYICGKFIFVTFVISLKLLNEVKIVAIADNFEK